MTKDELKQEKDKKIAELEEQVKSFEKARESDFKRWSMTMNDLEKLIKNHLI